MHVWAVWICKDDEAILWGAYPDIYTARHWVLRKEEEHKCECKITEMILEAV